MNQEEKIYQKIMNASKKAEKTSFPSMDKVWNRVEEKLDTKIIKKKSEVWKKLAIAASFLLFFTVGIQLYNTNQELLKPIEPVVSSKKIFNETEEIKNNQEIEKLVKPTNNIENVLTNSNVPKTIISETKDELFEDNVIPIIAKSKISEVAKTSFVAEEISSDVQLMSQNEAINQGYLNSASSKSNVFLSNRKIYAARSSNMKYKVLKEKNLEIEEKTANTQTKSEDLVLIDGKLSHKNKNNIQEEDFETYVELKNPIYIINGEEFSEESLFGEKTTSKYAPLTSQKIDSIKVYLPEEAVSIYGKKGIEGVVIITIKKQ